MSEIKIILLCSSRIAIPAIKELAFFRMLSAIAIPNHCDEMIEHVEAVITGSGIPLIKLDKQTFTNQIIDAIELYQVNLGLVITFSFKIPPSVYNLPTKGFYNVHPGPLPQYRGPDPIFQQIKNKEKLAGVTIHKLDEGIDTGPVIICEMLKLEQTDTYGLLTTKLSNLSAKLTGTLLKLVSLDIAIPSRQQDNIKAGYFKKQLAKDIMVNWQKMDANTIIALINACNPWNKGAVTKIGNQVIRLLAAEKISCNHSPCKDAGFIIAVDENGMSVSTIQNEAIFVKMIYAEEGYLGASFFCKLGMVPGKQFEINN
jgi:methionyl-tRNA formyltransferase